MLLSLLTEREFREILGARRILETLREVYAELTQGEYYVVNARLEERKGGVYLVPDHGFLAYISA